MYEILRQRFWAVLHTAISSERHPKLISLVHNEARVLFDNSRLLVILLDERPEDRAALQNWAKVLFEENVAREIDVIVLAPSDAVDQTLAEADYEVPWTMRLAILTLNENGVSHEITKKQSDAFARKLVEESLKADRSEAGIARMKLDVKAFVDNDRKQDGEILKFQRKLHIENSSATFILLGIIAAFFIAQTWMGGATYAPELVRMGANSKELVKNGEYWRLMTSIFLHGGFLHVLANSYVLYALGVFFNRLIGNARFITLFFFSGVVGSAASVWIGGSALSVGASGALWGLFGLSGALIVRPSHFLPDRVRQGMRKVTLINLAINLGISFLPMVDIWAHLGGGIAGFALGLFYVYQGENPRFKGLNTATAVFFSLIAAASIAVNMVEQRPWRLIQPPQFSERQLAGAGFTIEIPTVITSQKETGTSVIFGDINLDPYQISVNTTETEKLANTKEGQDERVKNTMRAALHDLDPSAEIRVRSIDGFPTASSFIKLKNGIRFWIWFQQRDSLMISVDVVASPNTPTPLLQDLDRIIMSLKPSVHI